MSLTILQGDWIERLRELPDGSAQTCVTSPPYWGLRDYGVKGQLGLEKTPEEYVARLVEGFGEVRRVLRKDGTLWLNLGDCYSGSGKGGNPGNSPHVKQGTNKGSLGMRGHKRNPLKAKDLIGVPWMVAFALRDDGWYLRSDIIWAKKNTMPESVTDRPTKAHEHIFLLSKRPKYYYDYQSILEPCSENTHARISQDLQNQIGTFRANGGGKTNGPLKLVATQTNGSWKGSQFHTGKTGDHQLGRSSKNRKLAVAGSGIKNNESFDSSVCMPVLARNKRDVWFVGTQPYSEAHFATFPPALIKPCILAGSRAGDTVLDPFFGSGTTGEVALEYGRRCIGIELNPNYVALAGQRCNVTQGLPL